MHPDRDRFGERGDVHRHAVRNRDEPAAGGGLPDQHHVGQPTGSAAAADSAGCRVTGVHDDPLTGRDAVDLVAGLQHHPGELVPQRHRLAARSGQPAQPDVGQVTAADPAGMDLDQGVPWSAGRQADLVEADVPGRMHPNLAGGGKHWR